MIGDNDHPLTNEKLDQVFRALSDPARRQIVQALPQDQSCEMTALTAEVADADTPEQTKTTLRHVHLPFLDDADVLDWDRTTNTVTAGARYDTTRQILQRVEAPEEATP